MKMDHLGVGQDIARVLYGYTFPEKFEDLILGLPLESQQPHWALHDTKRTKDLHVAWRRFYKACDSWYEDQRRSSKTQTIVVPGYQYDASVGRTWNVFRPAGIASGVDFASFGSSGNTIHTNDFLSFQIYGADSALLRLIQQDHDVGLDRKITLNWLDEGNQSIRFMIRGAASVFWREVPEGFHWEDKSIGNARVLARAVYDKIKKDLSLNEAREVPYAELNDWDLSRKPDKAFSLIPENVDTFMPPLRVSVHECFVTNDPRHFGWIVEVTVYGTPGIAESAAMASLWQAGWSNPSSSK